MVRPAHTSLWCYQPRNKDRGVALNLYHNSASQVCMLAYHRHWYQVQAQNMHTTHHIIIGPLQKELGLSAIHTTHMKQNGLTLLKHPQAMATDP